jgi:cytochrome c oxidase subunit IV
MDTTLNEPLGSKTIGGFALAGAFFGAVDGFLLAETTELVPSNSLVIGIAAGAILGAMIGAGVVLLANRPRPQDGLEAVGHTTHANYMLIWGVLFLMTVLEVGVAFLALPKVLIIIALLVMAVWKALLVALYYMHLKYEPRRLWYLAASPFPLAMILITAVLMEGFNK